MSRGHELGTWVGDMSWGNELGTWGHGLGTRGHEWGLGKEEAELNGGQV